MIVRDLMTKDVRTGRPGDDLGTLAHHMWDHDCGCIPIIDEQQHPIAMLTDRDICMAAMTTGRPLSEIEARNAMSSNVRVANELDSVPTAEIMMRANHIHRLPVVDREGILVGLLSLHDLVHHAERIEHTPNEALSSEAVAWTLAGIVEKPPPEEIIDGLIADEPPYDAP
jgi:CBS domain-containing protein